MYFLVLILQFYDPLMAAEELLSDLYQTHKIHRETAPHYGPKKVPQAKDIARHQEALL